MLDKLEAIKNRFDEVSELIVDPNIISDMKQYIQLNKEYKDLQPIIESYHKYKNILSKKYSIGSICFSDITSRFKKW